MTDIESFDKYCLEHGLNMAIDDVDIILQWHKEQRKVWARGIVPTGKYPHPENNSQFAYNRAVEDMLKAIDSK